MNVEISFDRHMIKKIVEPFIQTIIDNYLLDNQEFEVTRNKKVDNRSDMAESRYGTKKE
jgi:hypothetical protein